MSFLFFLCPSLSSVILLVLLSNLGPHLFSILLKVLLSFQLFFCLGVVYSFGNFPSFTIALDHPFNITVFRSSPVLHLISWSEYNLSVVYFLSKVLMFNKCSMYIFCFKIKQVQASIVLEPVVYVLDGPCPAFFKCLHQPLLTLLQGWCLDLVLLCTLGSSDQS